jgi:hypothetical protein
MWKFSDLQFKKWELRYLSNLVVPCERGPKIRKLNGGEKVFFTKFIKYLFRKACRDGAELLFRGDFKNNLKHKLFSQEHLGRGYSKKYFEAEFYDRLFIVGDKAKSYRSEHEENSKEVQNEPAMLLLRINCIEDDVFRYIFNIFKNIFSDDFKQDLIYQIERILNDSKLDPINTSYQETLRRLIEKARELETIESFRAVETSFCEYFQRPEGENFLKHLPSESKMRLKIRDYYLYLVHNFSSSKFSILCSTSRDIGIAEEFSNGFQNKDGVLFFYFLLF